MRQLPHIAGPVVGKVYIRILRVHSGLTSRATRVVLPEIDAHATGVSGAAITSKTQTTMRTEVSVFFTALKENSITRDTHIFYIP